MKKTWNFLKDKSPKKEDVGTLFEVEGYNYGDLDGKWTGYFRVVHVKYREGRDIHEYRLEKDDKNNPSIPLLSQWGYSNVTIDDQDRWRYATEDELTMEQLLDL